MSFLRNDTYDYATNLDSVWGQLQAYRWGGCVKHGHWFVGMFFGDGAPLNRFVACDCVVDDFGTLVPVSYRPSFGLEHAA